MTLILLNTKEDILKYILQIKYLISLRLRWKISEYVYNVIPVLYMHDSLVLLLSVFEKQTVIIEQKFLSLTSEGL